jgi:hypothetical protein
MDSFYSVILVTIRSGTTVLAYSRFMYLNLPRASQQESCIFFPSLTKSHSGLHLAYPHTLPPSHLRVAHCREFVEHNKAATTDPTSTCAQPFAIFSRPKALPVVLPAINDQKLRFTAFSRSI